MSRVFSVLGIVLLLASFTPAQQSSKELTIPGIWAEGGLTGRAPETVKWSPDGKKVSYVLRDDSGEHGQLWYIDVATGAPAVLVASEKLASLEPPDNTNKLTRDDRERDRRARYSVAGYHWSPDSKHLLFDTKGQLWYYRLDNGVGIQLTASSEPSMDPKFSPDGRRLAFVRKHNLWMHQVDGDGRETQITFTNADDGDNITNGEVDWLYEEELDVRSNYFWSPDGKHIAYLQMSEGSVPTYPITDYIPEHPNVDQQKYPYAGDPNPDVRVGIVDSGGGKTHWVNLPNIPGAGDFYIPRFGWVNKDTIYIEVLNRAQNQLDLYFADSSGQRPQLMLSEKDDQWVEMNDDFQMLPSGDRFLWGSWRDGHTHLYLYSFDRKNPLSHNATLDTQLTKGDFEVFGVESVDMATQTVTFTANEGDDRQRNLYSVKLDGSGFQRLSHEDGTHNASFSPDGQHYVDTYSALTVPPRMSFCAYGGACKAFWTARDTAQFTLLKPQFVDFKADDGTVLRGTILLPQNASEDEKVPLLVNPYGGPGVQAVVDAWGGANLFFDEILARDGIAVLHVDNRGMSARGKKFSAPIRHRLGETELNDQLGAMDQALNRFPQLDAARIGIWGWSYGGFMTSYAMTHSKRFKAGVAVAPVTDWHQYDSTYTERYMGLPKDNADAYKRTSVQAAAADLNGHLLLVHGTSDDNVHMQNTVQLVQALINSGRQYDLLIFPRKTHSIAGAAARTNLFERIRAHFDAELLGWSAEKIAASNPQYPAPVAVSGSR